MVEVIGDGGENIDDSRVSAAGDDDQPFAVFTTSDWSSGTLSSTMPSGVRTLPLPLQLVRDTGAGWGR